MKRRTAISVAGSILLTGCGSRGAYDAPSTDSGGEGSIPNEKTNTNKKMEIIIRNQSDLPATFEFSVVRKGSAVVTRESVSLGEGLSETVTVEIISGQEYQLNAKARLTDEDAAVSYGNQQRTVSFSYDTLGLKEQFIGGEGGRLQLVLNAERKLSVER